MSVRSSEAIETMNAYGEQGIPFVFIIDFNLRQPLVFRMDSIDPGEVLYDFNGIANFSSSPEPSRKFRFEKFPVTEEEYQKSFDLVMRHLQFGNSYLLNLTFPTPIRTNLTLRDLFFISRARYRLHLNGSFTVFSPESFIQIRNRQILSFPMKGTIDASIPDAERVILSDGKELAEHYTIVDLIRNDLSMVSEKVRVIRFRYIDRIRTTHKELLQVSSEIRGELPEDYGKRIGSILFRLLPAGSVSGAPKKKTVLIIREAETYERGYYTGVAGYFDGQTLDSCVMIRFIEDTPEGLVYKSGGGITVRSERKKEYQEMIDKVYVPVD